MGLATADISHIDFDGVDGNKTVIVKKASTEQIDAGKRALAELGVVIPEAALNILEEPLKRDELTQSELMKLALEFSNGNQIKVDTSKLPHTAELSPEIMKHYFEGNGVDYPQTLPFNKDGSLVKENNPTFKGNLQYLIGKVGVSSYLNLSPEHQEIVQKISDIILDDIQLKNPSGLSEETKDLGYFIEDIVNLLQDIGMIRSGLNENYKTMLLDIDDLGLSEVKCEGLKKILTELYPDIVGINEVHKFLNEQNIQLEMDYEVVKKRLLEEIARIKAEIKEKDDIIAGRKGILKEKDDIIAGRKGILKEQMEEIKEQDDIIAGRKGILKEQDDIIAGRKGILKEQDDIIAGRKGILKEQMEEIEKLNKYIKSMERFIEVGGRS
ncbi:MAG: hypothetical protein Q9M94_04420 [Candidatus Gracilibacteria bacterium]|nr:hypothetical protein [Candidatus Gracilibacteria bacterium]